MLLGIWHRRRSLGIYCVELMRGQVRSNGVLERSLIIVIRGVIGLGKCTTHASRWLGVLLRVEPQRRSSLSVRVHVGTSILRCRIEYLIILGVCRMVPQDGGILLIPALGVVPVLRCTSMIEGGGIAAPRLDRLFRVYR